MKRTLTRLRALQPLNWFATSLTRACVGSSSEWAVKHLPRTGGVKCRLPNGRTLRLWSRGDDWVSNQVFWRGWSGYEPETTPLFFRLATKARVTLDVGAHVGFYSLLAAHANPEGKVYAFEPMPVTYDRLRRNISLNGLTNVAAFNSAVGEADGGAEFYHGTTEIPCSCGLSPKIFSDPDFVVGSFTVPVVALDSFVGGEQLRHVDLVKIDTETTELQVLRGMVNTIRRDRPDIVCEVWGGPGQAMGDFLSEFNYQFYALAETGLHPYDGRHTAENYLFTTKSVSELAGV